MLVNCYNNRVRQSTYTGTSHTLECVNAFVPRYSCCVRSFFPLLANISLFQYTGFLAAMKTFYTQEQRMKLYSMCFPAQASFHVCYGMKRANSNALLRDSIHDAHGKIVQRFGQNLAS